MKSIRRLFCDQNGSSTVEFVLWVPLFGFLLMFTANASFVYMDLTRMENAARDGARRVAMGQFTKDNIAPFVLSQLPNADYSVDASCSTDDYACVYVTRPTDSMLPFTNFMGVGNLLGQTFGTAIKMRYEPGVKETTSSLDAGSAISVT